MRALLVFLLAFFPIATVWSGGNVGFLFMPLPDCETTFVYLTNGTNWTVPADWNSSNNTIEAIGGGGGGGRGAGGGGGGGAYSRAANVSLTPGSNIKYVIGTGGTGGTASPSVDSLAGGDTYFCNSTLNCNSIIGSAVRVGAKGGSKGGNNGSDSYLGGTGGTAAASVGSVKYSGGRGGDSSNNEGGGGGGGAGGPNGAGANGGNNGSDVNGGGGGGAGGGTTGQNATSVKGGNGGTNYLGSGSGAGATSAVNAFMGSSGGGGGGGYAGTGSRMNGARGGHGAEWSTHGSGGGGGGGARATGVGADGGLYGGGGGGHSESSTAAGDGANGIIVVKYCSSTSSDYSPNSINWANFNNNSSIETFTGFSESILVELSTAYNSGTPIVSYQINGGGWVSYTPATPASILIYEDDTLEFQVSGDEGNSASIAVSNMTAGGVVLDTVTGTVVDDPCMSGSPALGTQCLGNVYYIGSLSPGATSGSGTDHYMTTPGGCDGTSNPTCLGTDDEAQRWSGGTGTTVDIAELTSYASTSGTGKGAINTDDQYGDYNTTIIVNHPTINPTSIADICNNLVYGGYSDWYLPNRYELNLMFTNKTSIPGLDITGTYYISSTESNSNTAWGQRFTDGYQAALSKTTSQLFRCVRRFVMPDFTPNAVDWTDFDNSSISQNFTGINQALNIELSATYGTGTPTIEYRINGGSWDSFTPGFPALFSVSSGDSLEFKVSGSASESANITVTNLSDGNAVIDTVTGTVVMDPCMGSPLPGDTCTGGAIYLGSLSPGATSGSGTDDYMTTPSGCNNSSTPTCPGTTDGLGIRWSGAGGSASDIAGLTNVAGAGDLDDQYGDYNTTTVLAHPSIGTDSAAAWCDNLIYGGYTDWYLPNKNEVSLVYTNSGSIPGVSGLYWASTENSSTNAWKMQGWSGVMVSDVKSAYVGVRCVRRYSKAADFTPNALGWANFNNVSSVETFLSFNQDISIELSVVYGTGTPNIEYRKSGGSWTLFSPGSPATVSMSVGHTLEFKVSGADTETATITVTNLSDGNTVLDSVTGTVDASCAVPVGGKCWYLSDLNKSCVETCAAYGGVDEATISYAGSGGSDAQCADVLDELGVASGSITSVYNSFGCQVLSGARRRDSSNTTSVTTSNPSVQQACACTNDFSPLTAPTNLNLVQSSNSRNITISWTGGAGTGGYQACQIQYYNGSTWSSIGSPQTCDDDLNNLALTMPSSGLPSGWNGTQMRIIKVSNQQVVATFPQTLACSVTSGSATSTPYIDEDCNGVFDNFTSQTLGTYSNPQASGIPVISWPWSGLDDYCKWREGQPTSGYALSYTQSGTGFGCWGVDIYDGSCRFTDSDSNLSTSVTCARVLLYY